MADTREQNKPNGLNKKVIWAAAIVLVCLVAAGGYFLRNLYREPATKAGPAEAVQVTPAPEEPSAPAQATPSAEATPVPPAEEAPAEAAVPAPDSAPEPSKANVMLTGDLLCLGAQIGAANKGGLYDFAPSFAYVRDIFTQADFVAGNLETVVSRDFPYTASGQTGMPVLNAPADYLGALRDTGFDGVATVNNHCCDAGAAGIIQTIEALDEYGLAHTGTFASPDAERWFIADVNGMQIGFLAYSEIYNGKDGLLTEEERGYMINRFSEERAQQDIAALRSAGAEFVIAYIHWGAENQAAPSETQRQHAQQLADAGADVIAGSHSHCLQPAEYIGAADGRRVLCFYSLGNFVSSMAGAANNDTVIARLELERAKERVTLKNASYLPCRVVTKDGVPFVVLPVASGDGAHQRICQSMGDTLSAASGGQ